MLCHVFPGLKNYHPSSYVVLCVLWVMSTLMMAVLTWTVLTWHSMGLSQFLRILVSCSSLKKSSKNVLISGIEA